jgi:asparagine synthase (glutamine-hydrolysing)
MEDLLEPERIRRRGLVAPGMVERLKREHLDGIRTHADRLWTLMMLELWAREYLDEPGFRRLA